MKEGSVKYLGAGIAIAATYAFAAYLFSYAVAEHPGGSGSEGLVPGLLSFGFTIVAARSTWTLARTAKD